MSEAEEDGERDTVRRRSQSGGVFTSESASGLVLLFICGVQEYVEYAA